MLIATRPSIALAMPLVLSGRRRRHLQDLAGAQRDLERAVEIAPRYHRARVLLARTYEALQRPAAAAAAWAAAARLAPGDFTSRFGELEANRRLGNDDAAAAALDRLRADFPDHHRVHTELAARAAAAGDYTTAQRHYADAARCAPDPAAPLIRLAESHLAVGDRAAALQSALQAAAAAPTAAVTSAELADVLERVGQPDEAMALYERLLSKAPRVVDPNKLARAAWGAYGEDAALDRLQSLLDWPARFEAQRAGPALAGFEVPPAPIRTLFVSTGNTHVLGDIVAAVAADPDFEVDCLELPAIAADGDWWLFPVRDRVARYGRFAKAQPAAAAQIGWADVVFCEWCNTAAVWLSHLLPPGKRLVIRLHAYEALGPWPLLVDWTRVDQLVFVADHVRARVVEALGLQRFANLDIRVLNPSHDTARFDRPKHAGAERTLGLVGYDRQVKRADLALDILAALQNEDPSWGLRLVGREIQDDALSARLQAQIEALPRPDAVTIDPWTPDLPEWFRGIGYILSTSDREGTHEAVAQAMSSGAIAVVRRWPLATRWHGAERRYPNALHFDGADTAASAIGEVAKSPARRRVAAKREAAVRFGRAPVFAELMRLLRGGDPQ